MFKVRINIEGQTQVNYGDGWQDISIEEYDELVEGGFEECSETIN